MGESAVDRLRAVHEVVYQPDWVDDLPRLIEAVAKADTLVVRNHTQVRGAFVSCRVVASLGVGLGNIDIEACAVRGNQVIPTTQSCRRDHLAHSSDGQHRWAFWSPAHCGHEA
jgi:(S)-sulfolactate dehydrogenase